VINFTHPIHLGVFPHWLEMMYWWRNRLPERTSKEAINVKGEGAFLFRIGQLSLQIYLKALTKSVL